MPEKVLFALIVILQQIGNTQERECSMNIKVCISDTQDGFVEVNNIRLSSWRCGNFLKSTLHSAYVTKSCLYSKVFDPLDDNFLEGLVDRFQQTPPGAKFILVSSKFGVSSFRKLFSDGDEYVKSVAILTLLGVLDQSEMRFKWPLQNSDESHQVKNSDLTSCYESRFGEDYSGTKATTQDGQECQAWDAQAPNEHPYNSEDFDVESNYCRQPDPNMHDSPWCYKQSGAGSGSCGIPICDSNDDDGFVIIAEKGYSQGSFAVKKTVSPNTASRVVTHSYHIDDYYCVEPLQMLDSVVMNPTIYGLNDRIPLSDYSMNNNGLHVITSDPIPCTGKITGWQFIPANPGIVFLTVVRMANGRKFYIGSTKVKIVKTMITADLTPQYVCIRNQPIYYVHPGDLYGFYNKDQSLASRPLIKRIYPVQGSSRLFPCSRQMTWADSGRCDVYNVNDLNTTSSSFHSFESLGSPKSQVVSVALRPIVRSDFVYTCDCENDYHCNAYGDGHMTCAAGRCVCSHNYVYNARANRCVYTKAAFSKTAYQKSLYNDNRLYAASNAIDNFVSPDLYSGTYSRTKLEIDPWWVLDLGMVTFIHAVKITVPEAIGVYLKAWNKLSKYTEGHLPSHIITQSSLEQLSDNLEVIEVHGPFAWKVQGSTSSTIQILNSELRNGVTTYKKNDNLKVTNTKKVYLMYPITLHNLMKTKCLGVSTALIVTSSTSDCLDSENRPYVHIYHQTSNEKQFWMSNVNGSFVNVNNNQFEVSSADVAQETVTKFSFYQSSEDAKTGESSVQLKVYDTLHTPGLQLYIGVNDGSKQCLKLVNSQRQIVLDGNCDFVFSASFNQKYINWKSFHNTFLWNPSDEITSMKISHDVDNPAFQDPPCMQFLGTDRKSTGAVIHSVDVNSTHYATVFDRETRPVTQSTTAYVASSTPDLVWFNIGVAQWFNGQDFLHEDFEPCVSNLYMAAPGKQLSVDCHTPVLGRYVAVYTRSPFKDRKYHLGISDFTVLTLPDCLPGRVSKSCHTRSRWSSGHRCQHRYIPVDDEPSGFKCTCKDGFTLSDDEHTCNQLQVMSTPKELLVSGGQCSVNNGGCQQTCVDSKCECSKGYVLSDNKHHCNDIDECSEANGGCQHDCVNSIGSYYCICNHGYKLDLAGKICIGMHSLRLRLALALPFVKNFMRTLSQEYLDMKQMLDNNLNWKICNQISYEMGNSSSIPICSTYGEFEQTEDLQSIVFDFYIILERMLSTIELALLTEKVKQAIDLNKHRLFEKDDSPVLISQPLQVVYERIGQERRIQIVESACDYIDVAHYCHNGAKCAINSKGPYCKCSAQYYGDRCEAYQQIIYVGDFNKKLLVAAVVIMAFIVFALSVAAAILCVCWKTSHTLKSKYDLLHEKGITFGNLQ